MQAGICNLLSHIWKFEAGMPILIQRLTETELNPIIGTPILTCCLNHQHHACKGKERSLLFFFLCFAPDHGSFITSLHHRRKLRPPKAGRRIEVTQQASLLSATSACLCCPCVALLHQSVALLLSLWIHHQRFRGCSCEFHAMPCSCCPPARACLGPCIACHDSSNNMH